MMEPASLTTEELEHMAVVKLRAVARQIGLTSMTRKEIRFAKKEELLAAITAFLAEQTTEHASRFETAPGMSSAKGMELYAANR